MTEPTDGPLLIGVDAGGTKTKAVIARRLGDRFNEIGKGTAGPGNVRSEGIGDTIASVKGAIHEAFTSAGRLSTMAESACLCIAGAGRQAERDALSVAFKGASIAKRLRIVSDAEVLLSVPIADGQVDQHSVVNSDRVCLISGTGSIAIARHRDGTLHRCGGWGYLLGDEGSGYAIGRSALAAIAESSDGLCPATELTETVLRKLGLADPSDLIGWCYSNANARRQIASLAPSVFDLRDDATARQIIERAGAALARQVCTVIRHAELDTPVLVCGGSVLTRQPAFVDVVVRLIGEACVELPKVEVVQHPEFAALRLASQAIDDDRRPV